MKSPRYLLLALWVIATIPFACKKDSVIVEAESAVDASSVTATPACNIVTVYSNGIIEDTAYITYDNWNNPKTIKTNVDAGNPNARFIYDNKHRLSEVRLNHRTGSEPLSVYHRLYYDNKDRIVLDSAWNYAFNQDFSHYSLRSVTNFKYDSLNRMILAHDVFKGGSDISYIIRYTYNHKGNLAKRVFKRISSSSNTDTIRFVTTILNYDNKVNFTATNKIWQFICRDYSANNSISATTYAGNGLPLTFAQGSHVFFGGNYSDAGYDYFLFEGVYKIEYDCR